MTKQKEQQLVALFEYFGGYLIGVLFYQGEAVALFSKNIKKEKGEQLDLFEKHHELKLEPDSSGFLLTTPLDPLLTVIF